MGWFARSGVNMTGRPASLSDLEEHAMQKKTATTVRIVILINLIIVFLLITFFQLRFLLSLNFSCHL
jgi:hypothetical protein